MLYARSLTNATFRAVKLWSRKVSRVTLLYPVNLFRIAELDSPQLDIVTMEPIAADLLYELSDSVRHLVVSAPASSDSAISLRRLPHLESFFGPEGYVQFDVGAGPQFRELGLEDFAGTDLASVAKFNDLRGLRLLNARRLEDIGGLKAFSAMVDVEITYARSLTEFSPIAQMQALEKLVLERCTGLDNLGFTRALRGLRFLDISDVKDVASLEPLRDLRGLETLLAAGSTRILDGDLSPLIGLPRLATIGMRSRRDYTPPLRTVLLDRGIDPDE